MHKSYESLPVFAYPIRVRKFVDYHSVDHIHWHEEIELLYFAEGEGVISCNLKEYTVKAGDIVFVNGKEAALYTDNEKKLLPNRMNNRFNLFIDANKLSSVAKNSLKKTPMLQIKAKAIVSLIVEDDLEDPDSKFNQSAEYEGVIHASAN